MARRRKRISAERFFYNYIIQELWDHFPKIIVISLLIGLVGIFIGTIQFPECDALSQGNVLGLKEELTEASRRSSIGKASNAKTATKVKPERKHKSSKKTFDDTDPGSIENGQTSSSRKNKSSKEDRNTQTKESTKQRKVKTKGKGKKKNVQPITTTSKPPDSRETSQKPKKRAEDKTSKKLRKVTKGTTPTTTTTSAPTSTSLPDVKRQTNKPKPKRRKSGRNFKESRPDDISKFKKSEGASSSNNSTPSTTPISKPTPDTDKKRENKSEGNFENKTQSETKEKSGQNKNSNSNSTLRPREQSKDNSVTEEIFFSTSTTSSLGKDNEAEVERGQMILKEMESGNMNNLMMQMLMGSAGKADKNVPELTTSRPEVSKMKYKRSSERTATKIKKEDLEESEEETEESEEETEESDEETEESEEETEESDEETEESEEETEESDEETEESDEETEESEEETDEDSSDSSEEK